MKKLYSILLVIIIVSCGGDSADKNSGDSKPGQSSVMAGHFLDLFNDMASSGFDMIDSGMQQVKSGLYVVENNSLKYYSFAYLDICEELSLDNIISAMFKAYSSDNTACVVVNNRLIHYPGFTSAVSIDDFSDPMISLPAADVITLTSIVLDAASGIHTKPDGSPVSSGAPIIFTDEKFETGNLLKYSWTVQGGQNPYVHSDEKYEGSYAVRFNSERLLYGQSSGLLLEVSLSQNSVVSFYIKTDIGGELENYLRFYVDNVKQGEWRGLNSDWRQVYFSLTAGTHILKWSHEKNTTSYYPSAQNTVYIDRVMVVEDALSYIDISPAAPQRTVINSSVVTYKAEGKRADGTVISSLSPLLAVNAGTGNGTLDSAGLFTGTSAGTCSITASVGTVTAESEDITVLPLNYIELPVEYAGAVYNGKTTAGSGDPKTAHYSDGKISVTYPAVKSFDADGFFAVRGNVSMSDVYNYAAIEVYKSDTEKTYYWVRGDFETRLWLRFGAGTYTVKVIRLAGLTANLSGEGDLQSWSWYSSSPDYEYTVNNTRNEDGVFLYPSGPVQADNIIIHNKMMELTWGASDSYDKIENLHDWVVKYLSYDDDSLVSDHRKKQDALSTYLTSNQPGVIVDPSKGLAVCEGYTSLLTAFLRGAGIKAKAVSGDAGGAHAWNNVWYNSSWYFTDSTWDDPGPNDSSTTNLRHTYFMLTNMNGLGEHTPQDERTGRMMYYVPEFRGFPDGYY